MILPSNIKLIAAGVALAALGALFYKVNGWREDSKQLADVQQKLVETQQQILAAQQASKGFQDELSNLRANRAPGRAVRLCDAPVRQALPATGPDGPAAGAGEFPQEPGADIGPRLYSDADRADEIVAQCRGLQEWARSVVR